MEYNSLIKLIKTMKTNLKQIRSSLILRHEPKQRQKFLNEVDQVLCEIFDSNKDFRETLSTDKDWDKYAQNLRLAISKTLKNLIKNRVLH